MPHRSDFDALLGSAATTALPGTVTGALPGSATGATPRHPGAAPFEPLEPESVVLRIRRHGRVLVLPVVALIAIAGAAGYWVGSFAEGWKNLAAAGGAVALALVLGIAPVLAWSTRRITVTNRRVIFRHGVFVRHRAELPFSRVREVRTRRGPVQRVFGSGHIDLYVGSERTTMHDVPGAALVNDALQELVERGYEHSTGMFVNGQVVRSMSTSMS
ncbi:PH domain-containing protein [Leucobacter sp. gxy201]|uniref:PH domain-containing protein n=1 Tax=Leucobacter sp. gxy201 TaxID=2957200 RepID=UPI003DA1C3B6